MHHWISRCLRQAFFCGENAEQCSEWVLELFTVASGALADQDWPLRGRCNNQAERALRPIGIDIGIDIGRKNWYFIGSEDATVRPLCQMGNGQMGNGQMGNADSSERHRKLTIY